MKVLTVSHLYPNEVDPFKGVFVAELTSAIRDQAEVRVAAPISWFPILRPQGEIPPFTNRRGTFVYHPRYLALPRTMKNARWITYQQALGRIIDDLAREDFRPDILHSHWLYPDGFAAAKVAQTVGAKTAVTIHGHASLGMGIRGLATPKCREALELTDLVIAVSEELRQILITSFGVSPERIKVIHNGIDPGKFLYRDRETARRALGLALNRPIVLCVARLSEEKQIHLLVDAISRISDPSLQAFILGVGPLQHELQELIVRKGLRNRIILNGGVAHESLADWYCAADVFCLTSAHEGCPVVVHEALACGLPVVSTPVGAVPDLVFPGENGFLPKPTPDSIAAAIKESLTHGWDHAKISEEGRTHTWARVADLTTSEFARLLPGGQATRDSPHQSI